MESSVNFNVIKEKIIKTSELLQLYGDKSTKLSRANRAYKELKTKFETHQEEITRLKLDNERLAFSLNSLKTKDEELQNLRKQYSGLEDKYNQQLIESQLRFQDFEEKVDYYESKKAKIELVKNSKKNDEKLIELQEVISDLKKGEQTLKKEIAQLLLKNNDLVKNLTNDQKNFLQDKVHLTGKNEQLSKDIMNLNEKLKISSQNCIHLQQKLWELEKEKNLEISDLRKQVSQYENQVLLSKSSTNQESIGIQVCIELKDELIENGREFAVIKNSAIKNDHVKEGFREHKNNTDDILNEEIMLSVEDILKEMILPRALSPVSISSGTVDEQSLNLVDELDSFAPFHIEVVDSSTKLTTINSSKDIPEIIITPPTPNVEKSTMQSFPRFTEKPNTDEPNVSVCNAAIENKKNISKIEPEMPKEVSVQTQIVRKKFRTLYTKTPEFVKLRRKIRNKKRSIATEKYQSDPILTALQVLKQNKINFTISSDSIPLIPASDYYNFPTLYPQNTSTIGISMNIPKYPNTKTERFTSCGCKKCAQNNSLMLLDNTQNENLLGFFNVKREIVTPACSRLDSNTVSESNDKLDTRNLLNQLLDGIKELVATQHTSFAKSPTRKKKRKFPTNSEFNSETETEIERLFKKSNILQRNKMLLKAAKVQQILNSECDTLIESELDQSEVSVQNSSSMCFSTNLAFSSSASSKTGGFPRPSSVTKTPGTISSDLPKFTTCPELISPLASSTKGESSSKRYSERLRKIKTSRDTAVACDNTSPKYDVSGNGLNTRASRKINFVLQKKFISESVSKPAQKEYSITDTDRVSVTESEATLVKSRRGRSGPNILSKEYISDSECDTDFNSVTDKIIAVKYNKEGNNKLAASDENCRLQEKSLASAIGVLDTKSKTMSLQTCDRQLRSKPLCSEYVSDSDCKTPLSSFTSKSVATKFIEEFDKKSTVSDETVKLLKGSYDKNSCDLAKQLYLSDSDTEINKRDDFSNKRFITKPAQKDKKKPISKLKSKVLYHTRTMRSIYKPKNSSGMLNFGINNREIIKESDNESAKESADSGFCDTGFEVSNDKRDRFEQENHENNKIKIVQDILINKSGGLLDLPEVVEDTIPKNTNSGKVVGDQCFSDRKRKLTDQYSKVLSQNAASKKRRLEEKIKPSIQTDILGQVMQDMMKNRPTSKVVDVKKKLMAPTLHKKPLNRAPLPTSNNLVENVVKQNAVGILRSSDTEGRVKCSTGTNTEPSASENVNTLDGAAICIKNEDEIPDCPQSPEPEEVPEGVPKIIPAEPPKKLPPSKVQMLINKLINFPSQDEVLEEVVESFAGQDVEYIIKIIFDKVSGDINDKATNKYHPSPVLTDTQRTLLGFMARLQRGSYPEIYEKFLSYAELTLLNIFSCKIEIIQPVTRMYTAICKLNRDINRMRRFVCEAFYFIGDFAVPLFFFVLTIWAEVLPMESECKAFPMAKVLVQIVHLKGCNKPGYNLLPLRDLLHRYFGYPTERWNCDAVFEDILIEYLRNPALRSSDFMLLLFCKNKPTKWVYQKLKSKIMPLLDRIPPENHNLKAMIIILIGNICHWFSKFEEYDLTVIQEMTTWLRSLNTDETPIIVKKSIYLAVSRLPRKTMGQRKRESKEKKEAENAQQESKSEQIILLREEQKVSETQNVSQLSNQAEAGEVT